ncbi:MAG: winged helix-turn-helix domain-containing protein [Terriglobales bacterium]
MPHIVRFDCFEADLALGQLRRRGIRIPLRDQPFQVLASLLKHPGHLVTREELRQRLWGDEVFVDFDNSLNIAVARLRTALGESSTHPRFIETLPKRGYRFTCQVSSPVEAGPTKRIRLAVLPFLNLSGDPAQEYFSDAMTDEVITSLAVIAPEQLRVIARTTAMHYKGSDKDVARIGRELDIDYLVEGGVRRTEEQVAINVQLIRVEDQTHFFAKKYVADGSDIFRTQGVIAQEIAAHMIGLGADTSSSTSLAVGARRNPTDNLPAYNLYLQGRFHLYKLSAEGFKKAKQYLEEALTRDPEFALAYDALAELYWYLGFFGHLPPQDACSRGLFCAVRALEVDNSLAETHALLGMYRKQVDFNWAEVQREMNRALELNPTSPIVRQRYAASGLMPLGRLDEAVAQIELALESDPLSIIIRAWLGVILWFGRHYERAIEQARQLIELDPTYDLGYLIVGQVRCMEHAFDESVAALRKASELSGKSPMVLGWLGLALAQGGNITEARALLQNLYARAERTYVPPSNFAWIHFGLGEIDDAFVWMDRAVEARDNMMTPIKSYPFLDPIRNDPRFTALLRKMNLAPNEPCRAGSESRSGT